MPSIKQDLLKGVFWSAVEKYSGFFVSLVVSMILARLLTPQEFGVVAIATVIISFLQLFCTMGIGPSIIQRKDLNDADINSIFTFSLFIGLLFSSVFFILSWPISNTYNEPKLVIVCHILCIQVFFASANMVPNALMAKNKRFKQIATRTLGLHVISGTLAVIAAYKGAGIYALLISPVTTAIGVFLFNRHYYPVKVAKVSKTSINKILSFSVYQFLFDIINYFSRNLDKLIIGKYISMESLGYYDKSYRLMQMPMSYTTGVVTSVLQPVLTVLQDNKKELANKYLKIIKTLSMIAFPMGITLFFCGSEVIHIMFGKNWDGAATSFKILALSLPSQVILSTSGSVFQCNNSAKALFHTGLINTIITIVAFLVACIIWGNIEAVAMAWTISNYAAFIITYYILFNREMQNNFINVFKSISHSIFASLLVFIILFFASTLIITNDLISLLVKTFISIVIYLIYFKITNELNILKNIYK